MERALIEYLANSAWQLPLLAGGAWLLLRIARPEPLAQHWVWVAVLVTAVVLPLRGMVRSHVAAGPVGAGFAVAPAQGAIVPMPASLPPQNAVRQRGERSTPLAAEMQNIHVDATAMQWLMWVYVGAVLLGGLRLVWAWMAARRLVEHSREMVFPGRAMERLQKYGRRLGVELPRVRGSSEVSSPAVVGAWRPVLLLPENFLEHTDEEIEAALCHELAHVRRRDTLANLLCQGMALPLIWHPANYAVQRRIRSTREMVCDAMAAEEMRSEMGYAKCLVALARSMVGGYDSAQTEGLGLFDNNTLEERVMRLTNNKTMMSTRGKIARATGGAAVMMVAITMAAMFHVSPILAQAASASAPPATQSAPTTVAVKPAVSDDKPLVMERGRGTSVAKDHGEKGKREYILRSIGRDGEPYVIVNGERRELTPEEQRRIQKDVAEQMAKVRIEIPKIHLQMKSVNVQLNSPEFKKQMAEMQKQMQDGALQRDAQMAAMKAQMKAFKMPDIQLQMKAMNAQLNSPEFKKQMAEMQKQMQDGALQRRAQMAAMRADMQRQVKNAAALMDSRALEQEMAEVQKSVQRGELQRAKAIQILQDAQTQLEKTKTN